MRRAAALLGGILLFITGGVAADERRQFIASLLLSGDTPVEITVIDTAEHETTARAALDRASDAIRRLDADLGSTSGNLRAQLDQLPTATPLVLSAPIFQLFQQALDLSALTHGWFDIAAPSPQGWFTTRDYRRIRLDATQQSLRFDTAKMKLDLCWLLRAGAVDLAIASLIRDGISDARVAVDGVSRTIGHDLFTPWSLTLPLTTRGAEGYAHRALRYDLSNAAAAVIEAQSSTAAMRSVVVLASDALSAAAFAIATETLGIKSGIRFIKKYPMVKWAIVDDQGHLHASTELAKARGKNDR